MDKPLAIRRVRVAVSVFFGLLTVLLCVLWVRSFWRHDNLSRHSGRSLTMVSVNSGEAIFIRYPDLGPSHPIAFRSRAASEPPTRRFSVEEGDIIVVVPAWCYAILSSLTGAVLCMARMDYVRRFSLRTMFMATTLLAIMLGLGVWLVT